MTEFTPIIVTASQRSREWFEARLGNVTSSMVKVTMEYYAVTKTHLAKADAYFDLNQAAFMADIEVLQQLREKYPFEYCLRANVELQSAASRVNYRKGLVAERLSGVSMSENTYFSRAMKWGQDQEVFAKQLYRIRYGHRVEDSPLFLHPEIMTGSSPDGLVIDIETGELGNLESKSLEPHNHLYSIIMPEEVPETYIPQIQHQLWLTGRAWCDFLGYDPRMKREEFVLFVQRVERDDFYINEVMIPNVLRFLDECDVDERKFYAIYKKRQGMAKNTYWSPYTPITPEEVDQFRTSED